MEIENTINFPSEIINIEEKCKSITDFMFPGILQDFIKVYNQEKNKLPYHLNLLDELHANENSHSRILMKLFNAKDNDEYYILKSFLKFLGPPFSDLIVSDIKIISNEIERVDIRVRAKDFSILIENKIHDAGDQERQIIRYVEREEESNNKYLRNNNIYVLYLSNLDGKEPSENSFPQDLRKQLVKRYRSISYKIDILPWLESEVLPNCKGKDTFLKSAIEQYIDHLKGMFHLRVIEEKMNEKIKEHLNQNLKLSGKESFERIEILKKKEGEVNNILGYIIELKLEQEKDVKMNFLKTLYNSMMEDFSAFSPKIDYLADWGTSSIKLPIGNFNVRVAIDTNYSYGIQTEDDSGVKKNKIEEIFNKDGFIKTIFNEPENDELWYYSKESTKETVYKEFKTLCDHFKYEYIKTKG